MKEAIIQYNDNPDADGGHMVISLEPLVRCNDCKYHGNIWPEYCVNLEQNTNDDFYCADGERKEVK